MRPHRVFPSTWTGTDKAATDTKRPYNKDIWETRHNRNPIVKARPHGRGCLMMLFSDGFDSGLSAYSSDGGALFWSTDILDLANYHFPSDMVGAFSITDIGLPPDTDLPRYIGYEETVPSSPTLAQFKSYYYKCRAAKQIQSQIIDVVIFVNPSGFEDPGYRELKAAVDSTGFPEWLESTGANVYKYYENGTARWLDGFSYYLEIAHENTLDTAVSNWGDALVPIVNVTAVGGPTTCIDGNLYDNIGAVGTETYNLPTCVKGDAVGFIVSAAQEIIINVGAGDTVHVSGQSTTVAGTITSGAQHSILWLIGASSSAWTAMSHSGTWTTA